MRPVVGHGVIDRYEPYKISTIPAIVSLLYCFSIFFVRMYNYVGNQYYCSHRTSADDSFATAFLIHDFIVEEMTFSPDKKKVEFDKMNIQFASDSRHGIHDV